MLLTVTLTVPAFGNLSILEMLGHWTEEQFTFRPATEAVSYTHLYLLTEDEEFVVNAAERYGTRGASQAQAVIEGFSGLCAGGALSEEDKAAVLKALQDIYWESKARNVKKMCIRDR